MKIIANNIKQGHVGIENLLIIKPPIVGRLVVSQGGKSRILNIRNVLFCQADGNYTKVQLSDGKSVLVSKCLKEVIAKLPATHFERIHQSYSVNLRYVESIGLDAVELQGCSRPLPLSRRYKKSLRRRLGC